MPSLASSLAEVCPLRCSEPLSRWTTLGIGGPAEFFLEPPKPETLVGLLNVLDKHGMPWRILGGGANTLAPDGGVEGAVIETGSMRRLFREGDGLRLWPGVTLPSLVRSACESGLSGVERLIGVPGQVGGALAMNAGSAEWGIWDEVAEATLWLPGGEVVARTRAQVQPRYRDGNLQGAVVLEAFLRLRPEPVAAIRARQEELLRRKNATQPVRLSSAGCAFKNPPGDSAGRLIEAAGLKGRSRGGAVVSEQHANFIINQGGATAAGVRALLAEIEAAVFQLFAVRLERELVIWPEPEF